MKNIFIVLAIAILIIFTGIYVNRQQKQITDVLNANIEVILACENGKEESLGIKAFSSILEEEGVPYKIIPNQKLITINPVKFAKSKPAVIYPDGSSQYLSDDTRQWTFEYMKAGGNLFIANDTGSERLDDRYNLKGSLFDHTLGIQTINTKKKGKDAFVYGPVSFQNTKVADYFGIPKGKYNKNATLVGYYYGVLTYTYTNAEITSKDVEILAYGKDHIPLLAQNKVGKGVIFYSNLKLAYLKGHSDDLLARSVLKTFLFKIVKVPHLVSSPDAKGGLVINWHIDAGIELESLPWMIQNGYINKKLRYSMHITAGPDCDKVGDGKGFAASTKGRALVKKLMQYGVIGSHGGWAHNWFAGHIENNHYTYNFMKKNIKLNNDTLEKITQYPIVEYAAPDGAFPQPDSVKILKELGMEAYYYPGDSASAPNRSFYNGKMLSKNIFAFPVMTFQKKASLAEFEDIHKSKSEVEKSLKNVVDFVVNNRAIRVYYSHPYDVYLGIYKKPVKDFIDYCVLKQENHELIVNTMSYFREFLLRLIETHKVFEFKNGEFIVKLNTKKSLKHMVIAIPKNYVEKNKIHENIEEDENYYYVPADTNDSTFSMGITAFKQ